MNAASRSFTRIVVLTTIYIVQYVFAALLLFIGVVGLLAMVWLTNRGADNASCWGTIVFTTLMGSLIGLAFVFILTAHWICSGKHARICRAIAIGETLSIVGIIIGVLILRILY